MENTFFLPVGRKISVDTNDQQTFSGEFLGIVNFGGIPAIWLKRYNNHLETTVFETVVPIINVNGMTIQKDQPPKDGIIGL